MISAFEWDVASRYLRARKGDRFISIIAGFSLVGICLGVAVLIIVMSVMNGFREELVDRMLGTNGHAWVAGYGGKLADYQDIRNRISKLDGVVQTNAVIQEGAMVMNKGRNDGALIRGMEVDTFINHQMIKDNIKFGKLEDFDIVNSVAMGTRLAQRLGLKVGDTVSILSGKGASTPFGTAPRMAGFQVVALFEVGVYDFDNKLVFMPLEDAQRYFKMGDNVTGIEIFTEDPEKIDDIMPQIASIVEGRGVVSDWRMQNASFYSALEVERNVMFLILTLIIIIAAFNVITSLIMMVKEKSRDIAILRTMGAGQGSIMRIFMIAGASVGVIGTGLGFLLGVLIIANLKTIQHWIESMIGAELWNPEIRFLTEIPASMDVAEVLLVIAMSLALSFLATLYPSWRASRIDPVETLRYE